MPWKRRATCPPQCRERTFAAKSRTWSSNFGLFAPGTLAKICGMTLIFAARELELKPD
jgi:hypothetical protein